MDKTLQRISLIRELAEKIKKIPIDIKFSSEELDKTLQRLQKKHTTGITGQSHPRQASAQLQNPPRPASSGQQIFALDSNRYRNLLQQRERTGLALAFNSGNSKESQTVAQAVKNSPQKKVEKIAPTAPAPSNISSNLNQQPNLNKQPSVDGSLSGDSQDNTEKKAEQKLKERQVETVEQETNTKPPTLFQQKEAEQQPKEIKLFGNSTSEPKQQTGVLASSKPQGGLFAPKPQGGLFASKPQGGFFAPKPQGGLFTQKTQGGLFAPKAQGGLFAPKPQGGLFAPKPQGGLFAPKPQGGLFAPKAQGGLFAPKPQGGLFIPKEQGGLFAPKSQGGLFSNSPVKSTSDNQGISLFGKPQSVPLFGTNQPAQKTQPLVQKSETEKNQPSLFGTTKTIMPTFNLGSTVLPASTTTNPEPPKSLFSLPTAVASETSKQIKPTFGGLFGNNTNPSQPILKLQPVPEQPTSKLQEKPKPKPLFSINTQPAQNNLDTFASQRQKIQKKESSSRPNMFTRPINQELKKPYNKNQTQPLGRETEKPAPFTSQQISPVQAVNLYEDIPTKTTNEPPVLIIENKSQESPRKQPQANEKIEKPPAINAIGPGGQKIQMKPFYLNDNNKKQNIFGEKNNEENKNASAEPQSVKTNLFQTSTTTTNLFQNKPEPAGLFSGPPPSGNLFTVPVATTSLFGQPTSNLFSANPTSNMFAASQSSNIFGGSQPASKPLFGNNGTSTQPKKQDEEDEQGEEDGIYEANDEADPSLSTGNFQYIQTQVFFKETASKFREGEDNTKETIQNVVVSIQKFQDSASKYLYVRMANKCIALYGQLVPGITEIRVLNNNARNLAVKKILRVMENAEKPQLVGVKIQFKEESIGERFKQEVEQAIAKPA